MATASPAAAAANTGVHTPLPPVFPVKQLLVYGDEYVTTPYKRPGDGTRRRQKLKWRAYSKDLKTSVDEKHDVVRRKRALDWVYYPTKSRKIIKMNNLSEFCAWAKDKFIHEVEFVDLGLVSGKENCRESYEHYYRTQHPENDEAMYSSSGLPGEGVKNPFLGRPSDAMYGDYFFLDARFEQQKARVFSGDAEHQINRTSARISWQPLGVGDTAEGEGQVRFFLTVRSEDILPMKILDVIIAANVENRDGSGKPERIMVDTIQGDLPIIFSPGEIRTFQFEENDAMRDISGRVIRLHFFVDFEDPKGNRGRKHYSCYYFKGD